MTTQNRTWLCCVVFLDVVSFTKHHMQAQMAIKNHLDKHIRLLLKNHAREDYILLDRGDGAAVCFLLEPEAALYFALDLREAIRTTNGPTETYDLRIGINLGPVKIVLDVNGDKTTLGEGINCAARVMDFAGAGQIFVSRAFYEVIGCLSEEYADMFSYLGTREDKHVREFELYEVASSSRIKDREAEPSEPPPPAQHHWDPAVLEARASKLAQEIGPMARILVQRAAKKADTLEALDAMLAKSGLYVAPVHTQEAAVPDGAFEPVFLEHAQTLLGEYIGPIATLLVEQAANQASDRASLGHLLAGELANEQEKQVFLSRLEQV